MSVNTPAWAYAEYMRKYRAEDRRKGLKRVEFKAPEALVRRLEQYAADSRTTRTEVLPGLFQFALDRIGLTEEQEETSEGVTMSA